MANEDSDTPSEMYIDEIDIYEWDDFYREFGYYPDEGEDDEENEN